MAERSRLNENGRKRFVQIGGMVVVIGLALFLSSWRLDWWNGWAYVGLYVGSIAAGGVWMIRNRPEVINERGRRDEKTKIFDRVIAPFYTLVGLAQFVVAGLDERFGWSDVPLVLEILGGIGLVVSMAAVYWVMANNPFLAQTVRIRTDRGHQVATTGPYRIVRHPMYAGSLYFCWTTAFLLGSWWTFPVTALSMIILVVRTALEDRTLRRELPGYDEYAARVRYRLIPGVW
jgi:protein-S-isoprenylcysteine O-methyltransferase Ste14